MGVKIPPFTPTIAALLALLAAPVPCCDASEVGALAPGSLDPHDSYRVDALAPVAAGVPDAVRVLGPRGAGWPAPLRRELERRVRSEWPSNRIYGPIHSSVGLRLRYPLVTASVGGRVLVPVLESSRLQILGQLELPEPLDGPRRVVVLVDASSSANGTAGAGHW